MELEKKSVTISDGRVISVRRAKVKDLAHAENQPKNKENLVKYAQFAAKITIDGKPAVMEDVLEFFEDDLLLVASLFDEEKNA